MNLNNLLTAKKILPFILKAQSADDRKLKQLRRQLIGLLDEIGHKNFVTIAADILKNNFKVEGCNDARIPLKRIFAISLDELEEALLGKEYNLPKGHPLSALSCDHKDNIKKLKALNSKLGINGLGPLKDYYAELDSHIRKEEEILFPTVERYGMKEHPENLREEHKEFRRIITQAIEALSGSQDKSNLIEKAVAGFREKFIPGISNHIFRETFIFYPAALEFIDDAAEWENIKREFNLVSV